MKKITPFLWFDGKAAEAVELYVSIFKNGTVGETRHYAEGSPAPAGSVMSVDFQLDGQNYIAFNGGPYFKFTPAFSMFVNCETQAEVDELWDKLVEGGAPSRCGWLTDKYGMSWQIIPAALGKGLQDPDPAAAKRVMEAMMQMSKIDIATIEKARAG